MELIEMSPILIRLKIDSRGDWNVSDFFGTKLNEPVFEVRLNKKQQDARDYHNQYSHSYAGYDHNQYNPHYHGGYESMNGLINPQMNEQKTRSIIWSLAVEHFNELDTFTFQMKAWLEITAGHGDNFHKLKYMLKVDGPPEKTFDQKTRSLSFEEKLSEKMMNSSFEFLCIKIIPTTAPSTFVESSHLNKSLSGAFQYGKHADVTINTTDGSFKVSKFMLCIQSEVFEKMFTHPSVEHETNTINIKNADPEVVKKMFEYLYTGNVKEIELVAQKLLPLAHQYELSELVSMCAKVLRTNPTIENIIEQLELCSLYEEMNTCKKDILMFTKRNFSEIKKLPEWNKFVSENVNVINDLVDLQ
ncbi:TD and POZ domain-containing protein 3-like protein [Aphelenchoides besseyi]|nr:TD and POZ domain-containing protein 3-like protein [Aphelenchoides besseyi]